MITDTLQRHIKFKKEELPINDKIEGIDAMFNKKINSILTTENQLKKRKKIREFEK